MTLPYKIDRPDIALFVPSLRGGGAERVMVNLAKGFINKGLKVDLVLAKAEGPYLSKLPSVIRVIDLDSKRVLYSFPDLVRYLTKNRPRALLSAMSHANLVVLWAKKFAKTSTRMVISEHNTMSIPTKKSKSVRQRMMPLFMRRFYPWADLVVAVSKGVADDLMEITGLPKEKVRVVYNPVITPEMFAKAKEPLDYPWFMPGEPPVILGVGRLTKQKDFSTLIRAFALLRSELSSRLIILGEGEKRLELEALSRELGVEGDVLLPGFVDNPYKYMRKATVFVLSSKWEGLPTVLIESLALSTPVVSTDCPSGPTEILENGKYGLLVPVGDAEAMASAILETLKVPHKSFDFTERINDFSLKNITEQYLELLLSNKYTLKKRSINKLAND